MRLRKTSGNKIDERLLGIAEQKINEAFGEETYEANQMIQEVKKEAQEKGFGEDEYSNIIFHLDGLA